MPWKDPQNWMAAELLAPVFSFGLAILRAIYMNDGNNWCRRTVEALMCGFITLTAGYIFNALNLHPDWEYAAAGAIGFLGTDYVRNAAQKFINNRLK